MKLVGGSQVEHFNINNSSGFRYIHGSNMETARKIHYRRKH